MTADEQRVQTLKKILRIGLGSVEEPDLSFQDLDKVMKIASAHGLMAIAFDGLEKALNCNPQRRNEIAEKLLMQCYGQCVWQKSLFKKNWHAATKLSELLAQEDIEAVVLKGHSIAQYYPNPKLRYSCDLDLYIGVKDWEHACNILKVNSISLVTEVYKEVEFTFEGVYVELHRYITPVRGNKTLLQFERYLRDILKESPKAYFGGTRLLCPPLMFIVMLYIEHALGDLLHGKLTLKHIVDWIVLRKQEIDCVEIKTKCKEFGFERFLKLIDSLADVVEGKVEEESLQPSDRKVLESMFYIPTVSKKNESWFARRVSLFFDIVRNRRYYTLFGYCSMERFLLNAVWAHFFDKEVKSIKKSK